MDHQPSVDQLKSLLEQVEEMVRRGQLDEAFKKLEGLKPTQEWSDNLLGSYLNNWSALHWKLGNYDHAVEHARRALALDNPPTTLRAYNNLGVCAWFKANFAEAREYFLKVVELAMQEDLDKNEPRSVLGRVYNNLGLLYRREGEYEISLSYFRKSLIEREDEQDQLGFAAVCTNLGNLYWRLNLIDESEIYQKKALAVWEAVGNLQNTAHSYNNLCLVELAKGNREQAWTYLNKAKALRLALGYPSDICATYQLMSELLQYEGELTIASDLIICAKALFPLFDNPSNKADVLFSEVHLLTQLGRSKEGWIALEELRTYLGVGRPHIELFVVYAQAKLFISDGLYKEGLASLQSILGLAQKTMPSIGVEVQLDLARTIIKLALKVMDTDLVEPLKNLLTEMASTILVAKDHQFFRFVDELLYLAGRLSFLIGDYATSQTYFAEAKVLASKQGNIHLISILQKDEQILSLVSPTSPPIVNPDFLLELEDYLNEVQKKVRLLS